MKESTAKFKVVGGHWLFIVSTLCALMLFGTNAYVVLLSRRFTSSMVLSITIGFGLVMFALRKLTISATPLHLNWGNITVQWEEMDRASIHRDSQKTSTIHIFTSSLPPRHVELQLFNDEIPAFSELIRTHAPDENCLRVAVGGVF